MKVKRIVSILLSGVAASAAVAFSSYAQGNSEINQRKKIYECKKNRDNYVTMMNVNNQSYPLIEWSNSAQSNSDQSNNYNASSDFHQLIPNSDYPDKSPEPMIPSPDERYVITIEERCRVVSSRLDEVDYIFHNSNLELNLLAGQVPAMNLRTPQGNVLIDSKGNPFQSAPWVICAISQVGETCTRENMLFTLNTDQASEANQFLGNFINLINNPGEFQAIKL